MVCASACCCAQDVLADTITVGEALGLQQQAAEAAAALHQRMDKAKQLVAELPPLKHPKVCHRQDQGV